MSTSDASQDKSERMDAEILARSICEIVSDKKGIDPVLLDMSGVTSITDYFVIVTGTSPPHLKAMAGDVQASLKRRGIHCFRRAGEPDGNWIVLDYIDVVVHIFGSEARGFYDLEELWSAAPRVALLESTPAGGG